MQSRWLESAGLRLKTAAGQAVTVVYPGIRAGSAGPDYKSAVVAFGGGALICGDVELHLRSDDWERHGHQHDHAYDRVVLHVVGDSSRASQVRLADGGGAPTALLCRRAAGRRRSALPCGRFGERGGAAAHRVLAQVGVARLLTRACAIVAAKSGLNVGEVLVRRTARALGYSANSGAAETLGERLSARALADMLTAGDTTLRTAVVLGVAGLLPSQRRRAGLAVCGDAPEYEAIWRDCAGLAPPLEPALWRLHGLYPNNSPIRRAVALAELWPSLGPLAEDITSLMDSASEDVPGAVRLLERRFHVTGDGYWRRHSDFGVCTREADLIGGSKAREMVVNALLPCAAAIAMSQGDLSRLSLASQVLVSYPAAAGNVVTRHMMRQLGLSPVSGTAAVQQGLVHLFTEHCRVGLCATCPLGAESGATSRTLAT